MKFAYIRISSCSQCTERQEQTLDEKDFDRTYIDKCSGRNTDRPQLQAMLDNLRPGDSITCHSLDRLARNTFDLLDLVKKITGKGCSIVFLKEKLHFEPGENNPISTLMLGILSSIAEFERELIRARQAEGIAIAKAKHKFKGSTEKLSSDAAKELKELVSSKRMSVKEAMKRYGISRASVYNYLNRNKED